MFKWNMDTYQPLQMFKWNMYAWPGPEDVRVEHAHLPDSFRCSNGTWTPDGYLQMFNWNMYTYKHPANVRVELAYLPAFLQMF